MLISLGINVIDEWMTSRLDWLPCCPRAVSAMRMRHTLSTVCKSNWLWIVTGICECVVFMEIWMSRQCLVQQPGGPWIRARVYCLEQLQKHDYTWKYCFFPFQCVKLRNSVVSVLFSGTWNKNCLILYFIWKQLVLRRISAVAWPVHSTWSCH